MQKTNKQDTSLSEAKCEEKSRRAFLTKYGKLAAVTPVAVTALFSPSTSAAPKSCKKSGKYSC